MVASGDEAGDGGDPLIATAGADGGVALWRLADHIGEEGGGGEGGRGRERGRSARPVPAPPAAGGPACSVSCLSTRPGDPSTLLVGTRDGGAWTVRLGEFCGDGGTDAWSPLLRPNPAAGGVLYLASLPCASAPAPPPWLAALPAFTCPACGDTASLVAAALGRGRAALACAGCAAAALPTTPTTTGGASWPAAPPHPCPGGTSPLLRVVSPPSLAGRALLTSSAAGDVGVWVPPPRGTAAGALPALLAAAAPPRRKRKKAAVAFALEAVLSPSSASSSLLLAGEGTGDVTLYALPDLVAERGGGGAALVVLSTITTPDGDPVATLRLLWPPASSPDSSSSSLPLIAVGDAAGRMTTCRIGSAPGHRLEAVGTERVPGLAAVGADVAAAGGVRVILGFQGPAAVAVVAEGCPPPPPPHGSSGAAPPAPGPTREVLREACGGGGARPWCLGTDAGGEGGGRGAAVFAYAPPLAAGRARPRLAVRVWSGRGRAVSSSSSPSPSSSSWPPASPAAGPHHGFKARGAWLLPGPAGDGAGGGGGAHPPLAAALSAGEDGCLRAVVVPGGPPSSTSSAPGSILLGRLVDGAALRAVAACPWPWRGGGAGGEGKGGGAWLVVAAGAGAAVTAWRVAWQADGGGGGGGGPYRLASAWLATAGAPPGRLPSRAARAAASRASPAAQHRALALRVVPARDGGGRHSTALAGALVATSGGRVDWVALGGGGGRAGGEGGGGGGEPRPPLLGAAPPTRLSARPSPALSLAVADAGGEAFRASPSPAWTAFGGWVAVAGHADGGLQAWCVGAAAGRAAAGGSSGAPPADPPPPPALTLEGVHQSGITCLELVVVGDRQGSASGGASGKEEGGGTAATRLACVSGGDDQALTVTWLAAAWSGDCGADGGPVLALSRTASASLPSAHGSALRGLWAGVWAGRLTAVSVCLEQRARVWTAAAGGGGGGALAEHGASAAAVQVQCPENLAGLVCGEDLVVAVVGRGTEVFRVTCD